MPDTIGRALHRALDDIPIDDADDRMVSGHRRAREIADRLDGRVPPAADPATTATARTDSSTVEVRDLARPVDVRVAITDRERGAAPEVLVALTREAFEDGAEVGEVIADVVRAVVGMVAIDAEHAADALNGVRRALRIALAQDAEERTFGVDR